MPETKVMLCEGPRKMGAYFHFLKNFHLWTLEEPSTSFPLQAHEAHRRKEKGWKRSFSRNFQSVSFRAKYSEHDAAQIDEMCFFAFSQHQDAKRHLQVL